MDRIPPEILLHISDFLDGAAPSQTRLHDEPRHDMLDDRVLPKLKTASLVCKAWRILALPSLFRHILWRPKMSSLRAFTLNPISLLRFLDDHKLGRGVTSFTLIVDFEDKEANSKRITPVIRTVDLEWLWDQLFSVIDPLRFTMIAPPSTLAAFMSRMLFLDDAWSFGIPYHILSLARATRDPLRGKSSGHHLETHLSDLHISTFEQSAARASQSSWSAAAAGASTSSPSTSTSCTVRSRKAPACPLFTARPWTSLLLNEGSSIKVYKTYEFFLRQPPSMLGALLGCEEYPNDTPLLPPTVTDLNYVAIFPLSSHFETLLRHLPPLDRLFVQLTPRPGNGILQDRDETAHVDLADLWLERNTAYSCIVRELTTDPSALDDAGHGHDHNRSWTALRVFESGDAADQEAWEMAVKFVERESEAWRVEREGVFVKRDADGNTPSPVGSEVDGHAGAAASGQGQLLSV
ncbi:hypothetical protein GGR52DRAFT_305944 [Hypoxylon sp. FL1284]|nr:hypothetical protein GGR52DRAFT_305944 [Hypoxylon sp. FL1284]